MTSSRVALIVGVLVLGIAAGLAASLARGDDESRSEDTVASTTSVGELLCATASGTARVRTVIVDQTPEAFTVCSGLGFEVTLNEAGTPLVSSSRPEDVIAYYKTHPAENPLVIANQTADAFHAEYGFVDVELPDVAQADACLGGERWSFPSVSLSLCLPSTWAVKTDSPEVLEFSRDDRAGVGIYSSTVRTEGTKCNRPAHVETAWGELRICALHVDPMGGQGHGIIFPDGREGGMSVYDVADAEARNEMFAVLYSIRPL